MARYERVQAHGSANTELGIMFKTGGQQHGGHHAVTRLWSEAETIGSMMAETKETVAFEVYQKK